MHAKKRFLVATFGALVALTVQTPVSAYIVKAREAAGHRYFSSHPPSYLIEAFRDGGQRVLHADNRWDGWRAATPGGALAADDAGPDNRSGRFDSTLGEIDLHRLAEGTHGENGSGGSGSSGEAGEGAHTSAIGGGGRGYGGGGAGGAGSGGGGYGSGGQGSGAGEGNDGGWHNASFDGPDGQNDHGGTDVFTSGSGGLLNHYWGGNWGSNGSGSDSNFCDNGHGGGVGELSAPEPTTLLFLAGGLAGLVARRRRSSTSS